MIHRHKWGVWSARYEVEIQIPGSFDHTHDVHKTLQERQCSTCNVVDTRVVHDGRRMREEAS